MATLPPSSDLTGAAVTEGGFKSALTTIRSYLNDLFSDDSGNKALARETLQVPISGTTAKTGTYTAVAADCGQVINCTGTWTLTLTSAVTLGDGWNIAVTNTGSGTITVGTSLSQLIDGATSIAIGPGTTRLIHCTGAAFVTLGAAASKQLQSISASVASNAMTISADALTLDFRSTTLGSGAVSTVSGTPASLVISAGSTLGTTSGIKSRIAVLAINNAGTIELAVANVAGVADLSETGLISTAAEGGAGAADSASVIYSAAARTSVAYRVIGYVESTQATAGTWAASPSTVQGAGGANLAALAPMGSMVRVNTSNGYGSTNALIRRFTNVVKNTGSDITYTDSASLGGYFTINTAGVYSISYSDNFAQAEDMGLTLNTTTPGTGVMNCAASQILAVTLTANSSYSGNVAWSGSLAAGDVVRAHTGLGPAVGLANCCQFTISRVG